MSQPRKYRVTGMSCAACSARVEKAVSGLHGVEECSVNLLTNSMAVSGSAPEKEIVKAVEAAGYGASLFDEKAPFVDAETPVLKKRLGWSLVLLAVLMYFSMGHTMAGWPVPKPLESPVAIGLVQLSLTLGIMIINKKFFTSGFAGLLHRAPNMDTLVALGATASFGWSVYVLYNIATGHGGSHGHDFYFESAAMILTLITVGKLLEAKSKGRTTDALKGLMELAPKTATVVRRGEDGTEFEIEISAEEVKEGDVFVIKPGARVPVDGIVLEGASAIDESALTGESIPVSKAGGDEVYSGTVNMQGFIKCRATNVGQDTNLAKVIKMVSDATMEKAPIAKVADRISGIFVPVVMGIALITIAVWLLAGYDMGFALARGISVLVISCPCALGLATPVAIMVGSGMGAKNGILFKTAESLEQTGRMNIVVFDKTGTITTGKPRVTDIIPGSGFAADELLDMAYALERKSEHPLATAITDCAEESRKTMPLELKNFEALPGSGVRAEYDGEVVMGGNLKLLKGGVNVELLALEKAGKLAEEGKTCLFFSKGEKYMGLIAVADTIKEDSRQAIEQLSGMGIDSVMLTGDTEVTAKAIADQAGIKDIVAGVLPAGKRDEIKRLSARGLCAMVGDGINDAPALVTADTGIAIGAGTDIAIDAADVVLMKSSLPDVPAAIRLSRKTLRNIHQNLFWAFIYNIIGIPLAAGVWYPITGWTLSPMFGAAAMSLSSFCVVANALRLNFIDIHDPSKDKKAAGAAVRKVEESEDKILNDEEEKRVMEKTMKIEGMMCMHCEAAVKKALEELAGVESAAVSHENNQAVVTIGDGVTDEMLKEAVEAKDYKVISID